MAVKGYYPSLSMGFDLLFAVVNCFSSGALIVIGSMTLLTPTLRILPHMVYLGIGAIVVGILGLFGGILAMAGAYQESVSTIKTGFWLSLATLLAGGGLAGYAFSMAGGIQDSTRHTWFQLSVEQKQLIQSVHSCCGFNSTAEKTEGCEADLACVEPYMGEVGGRLKILIILTAVVTGVQLFALLCGCCLSSKVQKQEARKRAKEAHNLEAQRYKNMKREKKEQKTLEKERKKLEKLEKKQAKKKSKH